MSEGGASGSGDDKQTEQQFVELQQKMVQESQKLKHLTTQVRQSEVEKRKCTLTLQELADLPADVNTFRAIGRTFVLVDKVRSPLLSFLTTTKPNERSLPRARPRFRG